MMGKMQQLGIFMLAWLVLALPVMACAEHEAAAKKDGAAPMPNAIENVPNYPNFAEYVPSDSCNGIDYYDFGSHVDGAAYYVEESTGNVVAGCGGLCMRPEGCDVCPPAGWSCGDTDTNPSVKR